MLFDTYDDEFLDPFAEEESLESLQLILDGKSTTSVFDNTDTPVPVAEPLQAYTYQQLCDMKDPIADLSGGTINLSIKMYKMTKSQTRHIRQLRRMYKNRQSAKRSSDRKNDELNKLSAENEYLRKCSWAWSSMSDKLFAILQRRVLLSDDDIKCIGEAMHQTTVL